MRTLSVSATSLEREPVRLSDLLAEVLAGEGIDLFALETLPRLDEAQALVAMVKGLAPQAECWWVSFQVRSDGARLADGTSLAKAAAWAAQEAIVVAVGINCVAPGVVWMHCTRVGCYWRRVGGTAGRWGLRAVRTTLGQ